MREDFSEEQGLDIIMINKLQPDMSSALVTAMPHLSDEDLQQRVMDMSVKFGESHARSDLDKAISDVVNVVDVNSIKKLVSVLDMHDDKLNAEHHSQVQNTI